MCTFDYTPYTGCGDGQQHFYLQWMKCRKAKENNNMFCPLEQSIEMEELRKLSGNILSCPIHNPICVEQHEFQIVHIEVNRLSPKRSVARRSRAGTLTTRPCSTTPRREKAMRDFEEHIHAEERRRRKAPHNSSADSDHSQDSNSHPMRPSTSGGERASNELPRNDDEHESIRRGRSHRRVSSADIPQLPARSLTRRDKRHPSLPRTAEHPANKEEEAQETEPPPKVSPRPVSTLGLPRGSLIGLGLPASPDIHRRASVAYRSRSEAALRQPSEDGSPPNYPEQSWDPLPPRPAHRRRGAGEPVASQGKGDDGVMGRIEEHVPANDAGNQEHGAPNIPKLHTHEASDHGSRDTIRLQSGTLHDRRRRSRSRRMESRERSDHQASDQRASSTRDPSPGITAVSTQGSKGDRPPQRRNSVRPDAAASHKNDQTTRGRRYEEQVAEGWKWVAAREYMPIANSMATVVAAYDMPRSFHQSQRSLSKRESDDSGYGSAHLQQQLHQQNSLAEPSVLPIRTGPERSATPSADDKSSRAVLQKPPPARPDRPTPLELSKSPLALPFVVVSPRSDPQQQVKTKLLHRMGLRRKFSGLWERNGQPGAGELRS
ncbi:hypothetical protein B0H63DRAFT_394050 [Podospora didyma]|uniref:Uncharacterized protein n=1 Tax=Podospora didyma TaxID=330526 RepID=A0AAE0NQA7_9PEZI|nr:hypothetical protein B0H63DRAFT_394050 [Podospora didyma]